MCFFSLLRWNSRPWANLIMSLPWVPTPADQGARTPTRGCSLEPLSQSLQKEEGGRERSEAGVAGGAGGRNFSGLDGVVQELEVLWDTSRLSPGVTGWGQQVLPLGIEIHQLRFPVLQLPPPFFFFSSLFYFFGGGISFCGKGQLC